MSPVSQEFHTIVAVSIVLKKRAQKKKTRNDHYPTLFQVPESRFHFLCPKVFVSSLNNTITKSNKIEPMHNQTVNLTALTIS